MLDLCRELYNAALEHRRHVYHRTGQSVSKYAQMAELKDVKKVRPEYADIDAQVLEGVLKRLGAAFDAFFRRVRQGGPAGYPRFKGRDRYRSIVFRQTGWKLDGRRLTLRGIGTLRLFLSRPIEGAIKNLTLRRDSCGDWFVSFSCDDVPAKALPETGATIGLDLGITNFIATSDGETIDNPRPFVAAEHRLAIAQRKRSKQERGGARYRQQSRHVAKLHRKVARIRRDFHFKTAVDLVRRYDVIAVEDLNVVGLARMRLSKHVNDAGWGQFIEILRAKAEEAGRTVVAVNPNGTSQACSGCGCEVRKRLGVRTHGCPDCGLVLDRDVNAARNILTRAGAPLTASRPASRAAA